MAARPAKKAAKRAARKRAARTGAARKRGSRLPAVQTSAPLPAADELALVERYAREREAARHTLVDTRRAALRDTLRDVYAVSSRTKKPDKLAELAALVLAQVALYLHAKADDEDLSHALVTVAHELSKHGIGPMRERVLRRAADSTRNLPVHGDSQLVRDQIQKLVHDAGERRITNAQIALELDLLGISRTPQAVGQIRRSLSNRKPG